MESVRTFRQKRDHFRVGLEGTDDFKEQDLLLAEELPAVPAVVAALGEGEAHGAARAAVHHLVLHPVVGRRTARLVADGPAEDATASVTHQDLTVVPVEGIKRRGGYKEEKKEAFFYLLFVILLTWRWRGR